MTEGVATECEKTAQRLSAIGKATWELGWLVGSDRVEGRSTHGIGDERVYATGLVMEMAGDVAESAVLLMRAGRTYTAQSLTRNLIECEYLLAYFAEQPEAAREWLNADKKARKTYWSPKQLRERMPGMFREGEYPSHSDTSHPTAFALKFLASHATAAPVEAWWEELQLHLRRIAWRADTVVQVLGIEQVVGRF